MWREHTVIGKYTIRFEAALGKFGFGKLEEIARKVETLPRWDKSSVGANQQDYVVKDNDRIFEFKGEIDTYMGIQYIAFPISDPTGKLAIIIESRASFEQSVAPLKDLVMTPMTGDGSHRHGKE